MSIGFLFLGGGCLTFATNNGAVAALLIALYPRFPTAPNDHRCHLQVLTNSQSWNVVSTVQMSDLIPFRGSNLRAYVMYLSADKHHMSPQLLRHICCSSWLTYILPPLANFLHCCLKVTSLHLCIQGPMPYMVCVFVLGIQAPICLGHRGTLFTNSGCGHRLTCICPNWNDYQGVSFLQWNYILPCHSMYSTWAVLCMSVSLLLHSQLRFFNSSSRTSWIPFSLYTYCWVIVFYLCLAELQLMRVRVCGPRYWPQDIELPCLGKP